MKDFKMPVAVITFLAAQAGGMVWFLSGMEGRVKTLEGKRLGDVEMIAKENRRYIREVIQPSYNISDAWANPHFDAWLKQGGWADAPVCPFAKQEMKSLLIKIGVGVSLGVNLFVFTVAAYGLLTQEKRISENRSYMEKVIESEVIKQIKFMMPSSTGTVVK